MKEILFGTTNEAKVRQLQGVLAPIGIIIKGVADKALLPVVTEDGATAQENAKKKALAYARAFNTVVLSMDNALFFDALPPERQPGLHVRRISASNQAPSDNELLTHYAALVEKLGDRTTGRWEFAICVAQPNGDLWQTTILSPRRFTNVPSSTILPGYPLESIQIDPVTGKYISEMTQEEQDLFWQRAIGRPLQEFIKTVAL